MADGKQEMWSAAIGAFERGAHSVLEQTCRRYLELDPENFPARMLWAHALMKMKRFQEAGDLLEGANPIDEREVVLWHRTAGDYYNERGDYEAAEDEYASALALVEEQTPDLVLDLVDALIDQGRSDAALEAIDTFAARKERDRDDLELLIFAKARALRNVGDYAGALEVARRAATHADSFPAAEALVEELEARIALEDAASEAVGSDAE
jgi:tetratricopeptide (TPR) repeat protein